MRIVIVGHSRTTKDILRQLEKALTEAMLREIEKQLLQALEIVPESPAVCYDSLPETNHYCEVKIVACKRRDIGHLIPWYTSGFE